MTTILGIGNAVHDTGAALLADGNIVGAVNEGRLSRVKREQRFPSSAVSHLLENIESVDRIALSAVGAQSFRQQLQLERKQASGFTSLADGVVRAAYGTRQAKGSIIEETAQRLATETPLADDPTHIASITEYVTHHRSHASGAYFTSGFDDATIICVDAAGDGLSSSVWTGEGGEMRRVAANDSIDSLGLLWTLMPTVFGFKGGKHAGKFMGMAPYCSEVPSRLEAKMKSLVDCDGLEITSPFLRDHADADFESRVLALKEIVGEFDPPAVARALQEHTEKLLSEFVSAAVERTGITDIALAGGVTANVKVNQRLYELPAVDGIFVHQNMGDGGLGLGAALDVWARKNDGISPTRLEDVYLGPSYSDEQIQRSVDRIDIPQEYTVETYETTEAVAEHAGELLADGDVVNLYTGRMEYGPRALGNRSILYQPTDPSAIEWLNNHLDRTEFMPFAPVTLAEYADECYQDYDPETCPAASFMTITFDCTEEMRERSPGAVHIDGTARPQILRRETNPLYYDIIDEYRKRTGIPTLINTSFNMHGEPIVCKPSEALRSFLDFGTKALVMDRTVVRKGGQR
jgi:carbamoyltransferase